MLFLLFILCVTAPPVLMLTLRYASHEADCGIMYAYICGILYAMVMLGQPERGQRDFSSHDSMGVLICFMAGVISWLVTEHVDGVIQRKKHKAAFG
ncbi:hypothetical protein KW800_00320 [Candidatus Parcubacteria bacterium]|nr:hypothetical protein [Candidatus Parcubacteria bacterium]